MVTRVHRNTSGADYAPKVISLGPVTLTVESDNAVQGVELVTKRLEDDSEPMREIADFMVAGVRENILSGTFTPILPETIKRRQYPFFPSGGIGARAAVGGSQPLVAGQSLMNGIVPRSKAGYAAAQRGKDEWYGFLHDGGVGQLDRRTFMELSGGQQDGVVRIYDEWLDGVVEA